VRSLRPALSAAVLCLWLSTTGCQAYHTRYWSFPLNSMQMVENGAHNAWSYRKTLGMEFLSHLFPYYWLLSVVDFVLLPFTLPHDLIAAAHDSEVGKSFEEQVRGEHSRRSERPTAPNLGSSTAPVPAPGPSSGFER
jgi:hypothetical protein